MSKLDLQDLGGGTLGSTARLKESVVAGVACVVSLPNPAAAQAIPAKDGAGGPDTGGTSVADRKTQGRK